MNRCFYGDVRQVLRELIAQGVKAQMCVTSPPYYALRDYGVPGQLGLEPTLGEYLANMVEVFALVREVLAEDGTCWINIGDAYANDGKRGGETGGKQAYLDDSSRMRCGREKRHTGLKPKDMMLVPQRLAIALQDAGWWVRSEIIWYKKNPMPESVEDRPTKAHEQVWLLSKAERYYYDGEAIKERCSAGTHERYARNGGGPVKTSGWAEGDVPHTAIAHQRPRDVGVGDRARPRKAAPNSWKGSQPGRDGGSGQDRRSLGRKGEAADEKETRAAAGSRFGRGAGWRTQVKNNESFDAAMAVMPEWRNKRSVWEISTEAYSGAHFATFPPALIEPCILAGSRPGDIVLDPFFGSGTTGEVCNRLGRQWIGVELNEGYRELIEARTAQGGLVLA